MKCMYTSYVAPASDITCNTCITLLFDCPEPLSVLATITAFERCYDHLPTQLPRDDADEPQYAVPIRKGVKSRTEIGAVYNNTVSSKPTKPHHYFVLVPPN